MLKNLVAVQTFKVNAWPLTGAQNSAVGVRRFLMVFAFNPTQPNMLLAAGRRLMSSVANCITTL